MEEDKEEVPGIVQLHEKQLTHQVAAQCLCKASDLAALVGDDNVVYIIVSVSFAHAARRIDVTGGPEDFRMATSQSGNRLSRLAR